MSTTVQTPDTDALIAELEAIGENVGNSSDGLANRAAQHLRAQRDAIKSLMDGTAEKAVQNSAALNVIVQNRLVGTAMAAMELLNMGRGGVQYLDPVAVMQLGKTMGDLETLVGILAPELVNKEFRNRPVNALPQGVAT